MSAEPATFEDQTGLRQPGRALVEDYLTLADDSAVAVLPHVLRVFVELGLPETLAGGPLAIAELAGLVGAHPDPLRRLLTTLAGVEVVRMLGFDRFGLTDLGERLLPTGDARVSVANLDSQLAWAHATEAVRGGRLAFAAGHDRQEFFAHKDSVPAANRAFLARMRERARRCYRQFPAAVDWTQARAVLDVGGGDGFLLGEVLAHGPHLQGRLFDRAATLATIDQAGLRRQWGARWEMVAGDFFDELPAGCDVHLLASVLHDWNDDQVVRILQHSRAALEPGGRLLVVEMLLPDDDQGHPARWSDLGMMVLTGGRERTSQEYETLLYLGGYELVSRQAIPDSFFSVLSASPGISQ